MTSRTLLPTAPIEVALPTTPTLPTAVATASVDSRVDIALFRGDLLDAVSEYRDAAVADLRQQRQFDARRAEAAVDARLVLRASVMLEGWGVKLARWVLEASATGRSQHGGASELFSACASALDPSLHVLLNRSRVSGLVRRADAAVAIGQCARRQRLFERLVEQSSAQALSEFNRFYWRPIHFAAAFGSELIVQTLLELGADPTVATGAGLTPVQVAVAHHTLRAVEALARAPRALDLDWEGRTPDEFALAVIGSEARCRLALRALGDKKKSRRRRRCADAARERAELAEEEQQEPSERPAACDDGGGWAVVEEKGAVLPGSEGGATYEERAAARRCDFAVMASVDAQTVVSAYLSMSRPLLVTDEAASGLAAAGGIYSRWRRGAFAESYGDIVLEREAYPYATAAAHLYGYPADNGSTVSDWLASSFDAPASADGGADIACAAAELPSDEGASASPAAHAAAASGVPSAVFTPMGDGWRRLKPGAARTRQGDIALELDAAPPHARTQLLRDYRRPSFLEDEEWMVRTGTIQFYLGPRGSGTQPHWHGSSWNWLVHGRKEWQLWPPAEASYAQQHVALALEQGGRGAADVEMLPASLRCEQLPGEVLLVPHGWGHATVNLEPSIGWASEVNLDRVYDDGLARMHGAEWWRVGAEERERERAAALRDERGEGEFVDVEEVDEDEEDEEME
jgi:hypothetical protein